MGRPLHDITGAQFGGLTVVKRAADNKFRHPMWECECSCGRTRIVAASSLRRGDVRRCGSCGPALSPEDIGEIKRLRAEGMSHAAIADRFGVTRSRVQQLVPGRRRAVN